MWNKWKTVSILRNQMRWYKSMLMPSLIYFSTAAHVFMDVYIYIYRLYRTYVFFKRLSGSDFISFIASIHETYTYDDVLLGIRAMNNLKRFKHLIFFFTKIALEQIEWGQPDLFYLSFKRRLQFENSCSKHLTKLCSLVYMYETT